MESCKIKQLYHLEATIAKELLEKLEYPWEALSQIEDFIRELGKTLDPNLYEQKGEDIWIAKSAEVAPTASIHGPAIIDEEAQIRHCAFIRGSAIVGKKAVVGNSTELKNVILFDQVQVPHYNYVGDSILGYKSHMVEVGCGSVLNPGTVIGKNSNIYPLSMVRGVVPANSIYKNKNEVVEKQ